MASVRISKRIWLTSIVLTACASACANSDTSGGGTAETHDSATAGDAGSDSGGDETAFDLDSTPSDTGSSGDDSALVDSGKTADTGATADTGVSTDSTMVGDTDDAGTIADAGDETADSVADTAMDDGALATDSATTDAATDTTASDSGSDGGSIGITVRQMADATAAGHPASGTSITDTEGLVALSPRLLLGGPSASGKCTWGTWVGTAAGGDFSGIQVVETVPAVAASCTGTMGIIPTTLAIGDRVTKLAGTFTDFCPAASGPCPSNTAAEVALGATGVFTVGTAATAPAATVVTIAEIKASGATPASKDLALQGTIVRLDGTIVQQAPKPGAPPAGNFDTMLVSAGSATTPQMPVLVKSFPGAACVRGKLTATTPSGTITGILVFDFGQWVIEVRSKTDISGVTGC